ncbi:MAG TPA: GreA/GreB family elongation factor [Lacunisphaera sp.]
MNHPANLHLSTTDHQVLSRLIAGVPGRTTTVDRLRGELARAIVLDPAVVPTTAVGLNSRVEIEDLDTHEREEYQLVLPAVADPDQQRLSVLAPVGTALLGYSEGDEIEWPTPGGSRRLKLLRVTRGAPLA